jgi:hypothetical protein
VTRAARCCTASSSPAANGGYVSFATARDELAGWLNDLAWTSGDGPRALYCAAVAWLRQRQVLLPGVTTLVELVAQVGLCLRQPVLDHAQESSVT